RHAFLRLCDDKAAHLFPADRVAGFLFQTGVKLDAVFIDFGHAVRRAKTADQPGAVPRGAASQLFLLQQHNLLPAQLRKVVRDAATDDTATDNDDSAFGWQLGIHWDGSLRAKHFFTMPR